MTSAWRLDNAKRARDESFSGEGARSFGGRWNRKGVPAVYLSDSLALAALEKFVHSQADGKRIALVSYKLELPDSIRIDRPGLKDLPSNWRQEPPSQEAQDFGTAWLNERGSAVLMLPSVLIPRENNFMLNPAHADFGKIRISIQEPFSFDSRMWK